MLGGSGSHNENAYHRGSPYDYDNFARITGDNSWNYRNALRHFKNFERHTGPLINENERTGWKLYYVEIIFPEFRILVFRILC